MSDSLPTLSHLSDPEALAVERACTQFEAAWRDWHGGPRPALERWLDQAGGAVRAVLLAELLQLELAYRRRAGERPALEEYLGRFPADAALLRGLLAATPEPAAGPAEAVPPTDAASGPTVVHQGPPGTPDAGQPRTRCLSPAEIQGLVTVSLSTSEGVRLAQHLGGCPRCQEEMEHRRDFEAIRRQYQAVAPPPAPPEVPDHVVGTCLGRGGFGEVWKGHNPGLNRWHALKVLHADRFKPEALAGLRREAQMMAALPAHPNRVQVFRLIEQDAGPVLVMAFVEGGPLSGQAPMLWERAVRYVIQAADALQGVHEAGLLHRDLKPGNLLWDRTRDLAVLADYGLATHAADTVSLSGTSGYLAPELLGRPASVKSDVFGLAATLFHLVTGEPPFDKRNPYTNLLQAQAGLPRQLPALSQLPKGVEDVIRAGMEPDPVQRPDLDRFLALLRTAHSHELAERLRVLARRSSGATRLQVAVSVSAVQPLAFRPVLSCSSRDAAPVAQVRPGDVLRLEVTADADGHLTVLNVSAAGEVDVLVPGPLSPEDGLRVGQMQRLTVQIKPPGPDHLALIWTPRPSRLSPRQWCERIAAGRRGEPERRVEFVLHESDAAPDDWTAVVLSVRQRGT